MREFVADTHALLWHFFLPRRLGVAARQALAEVDEGTARLWVPAVAMAEALMVAERRRLPDLTSELLLALLERLREADNYRFAPLTPEIVLASADLKAIPDIFDRLIVTEALQRGLPLLTRDPVVQGAQVVTTIWE